VKPVFVLEGQYKLFCIAHPEKGSSLRAHAFAMCPAGRARIWLEPEIEICKAFETGLSAEQLAEVLELAMKHAPKLLSAWKE
jgi:hypothetical protein